MPCKIICDTREVRSGVPERLVAIEGAEIEIRDLEIGDYLISDECVIERKSASDFNLSILDGRLFVQAKLMRANFSLPVMIIEGDIHSTRSGIAINALQGALSALAVLEGITIVPSQSPTDTAGIVSAIARHLTQGLGYEIPLRVQKPKERKILQQYCVEGLPACGGKRSQDILKHFGSIHKVFNASVDELAAVPGVGKGTALKIYDLIHEEYNR